ncbi:uncharacterized protein LOC128245342 [Mya arenaria]|uniref:uncharacterized protein LOC128245342 n=1 Tax=Mya arenaria TaxID=6604 RepID=UPI0022E8C226|nr:uncharacterized protein LOC128245342 [Mya arenaria]
MLDHIGYSQSMVHDRRAAWREHDAIMSGKRQATTEITAGSKGEGFTAPFESDTDCVILSNNTLCRLPDDDTVQLPDTHYEFIMDYEHCHPGHFRLELKHTGTLEISNIEEALFVHDNGRTFISSAKYRKSFIDKTNETVSGPALTGCTEYLSWDHVYAFPCTSQQQLLSEWINRPRHHHWPSSDLISEVSELQAQMVPVGCKSSEHKDIEWRVCFIFSEQKLTDSWNGKQYKVYILLKLLTKSQLKPINDVISSYLLKNIMLWFTEQNPTQIFKKQHLFQNVISCLRNLKDAIHANYLPYYMVPSRNLLTGRMIPDQQQQLIAKLDELIQEGPLVIMRCPKVLTALNMSPTELARKGRWRNKLEKLYLQRENIWPTYWWPGMETKRLHQLVWSDPHYASMRDKLRKMLWPEWKQSQRDYFGRVLKRKVAGALS